MNAKKSTPPSRTVNFAASIILLIFFLILQGSSAFGDSASYFYDDMGRLSRVVKGTSGIIYKYDELGNLLSVTSATTANASPVITSINPSVLFVGSKALVTIVGQNLLTTDSVTSVNGLCAIGNLFVTDTLIIAEVTALAAGADTIRVTTLNGTPNSATVSVTLSSSKLTLTPGQLAIAPGGTGSITAAISPPLAVPVTINFSSSNPSVATVPQSVTIPVSGSASFAVNALQLGISTIDAGDPRTIVFVANPFVWDVGESVHGRSSNVSVMIDAPAGTSPTAAAPVSVYMDAPSGTSASTATPVSVYMDAAAGTSPSTAVPVSVYVDAPAGDSPTTASGVSVKIQ